MSRKISFGWCGAILLSLSLISPQVFANHPTLLSNCDSFKLNTFDYIRRVDSLIDNIENLVKNDIGLQERVEAGIDITDDVYAAKLIDKMPDCNEDSSNRNIQVVGGGPLNNVDGASFTLILRAVNFPHCVAIDKALGRVGRTVVKRAEVPNEPKGQWGQCVGNPITWGLTLGKSLPMPNVAYINVQLNGGTSRVSTLCQQPSYSSDCDLVNKGKADFMQELRCATQIRSITDTYNKIFGLSAYQLTHLNTEQREELLAGLLKTVEIPKQRADADSIKNSRKKAAELIYKLGSDNNVVRQYWDSELQGYEKIGDRIYEKACTSGWHHLFDSPAGWAKFSDREKQGVILEVLAEFNSVIPITLREGKVYIEEINWANLVTKGVEAYYVSPSLSEDKPLYNYRDTIVLNRYALDGLPVWPSDFKYFIRVYLEEMMHAHQRELWEENTIWNEKSNPYVCLQARLFTYNAVLYSNDSGAYRGQPMELHAKRFSEYVSSSMFSPSRKCP